MKVMISEIVAKHAGFVMAHAAAISSVLESGELICPFVVVMKGDDRQSIEFEAKTQDEAINHAWASLVEYQSYVDLWAMAREGLISGENGKDDVLLVAVWAPGMSEAVIFSQRFRPKACGGFFIFGPVMMQVDLEPGEMKLVAEWFVQGIAQHPKGDRWSSWLLSSNNLKGDTAKPPALD